MNCSQIRSHLKDYLDDNIHPRLQAIITGHLSSCDGCSKELAFLKTYLPQAKDIGKIVAPPGFELRLRQKLPNPSQPSFPSRKWFLPLPAPVTAFVGILITAAVIFYFSKPYKLMEKEQLRKTPASASYKLPENRPAKKSSQKKQAPVADSIALSQEQAKPDITSSRTGAKEISRTVALTLSLWPVNYSDSGESAAKTRSQITVPELSNSTGQSATGEGSPRVFALEKSEKAESDAVYSVTNEIRGIVNSLGGKTATVKKNSAQLLIIKIQAQQYQQFVHAITKYGEVKKPYPKVNQNEQSIEIELGFQEGN